MTWSESIHVPVNVVVVMAFATWASNAERRYAIAAVPDSFFVPTVLATVRHDAEGLFVAVAMLRFRLHDRLIVAHFIAPL